MTTASDLKASAYLCNAAAQAALQQQQSLGPCPQDPVQADAWTHQNSQLQHNVSALTNLGSSLSAQAVSAALDAAWPSLQGLTAATASAQADIANIASISAALTTLAAVISFGVGVAALAAAPSPTTAVAAVTAFNAMTTAIAANTPPKV